MMCRRLSLVVLMAVPATVLSAGENSSACIDLRAPDAKATLSGRLTVRTFPGPPNYESIAKGDAAEKALILVLARPQCANGEFIDGPRSFDRVHLSSNEPKLLDALNAAVGRHITVSGEAFDSHTGHHHAPLVLFVESLRVR